MKNKVANSVIVGMVLIGTFFLGNLAQAGKTGELMPTLFLCFFALIIAIQVVPAFMLFGALVKGLFRMMAKPKEGSHGADR